MVSNWFWWVFAACLCAPFVLTFVISFVIGFVRYKKKKKKHDDSESGIHDD